MEFENSWGNPVKAEAYSKLEFPNTYYLAYRDLPEILAVHIQGVKAIDFGCGAGRSTRFLKNLGFDAVGIDISIDMLNKAREMDPGGEYQLVTDGNYHGLGSHEYDLVQSIFTFDNIPGKENRTHILKKLGELLKPSGKLICLDTNSEMYTRQWASFSTREFPENKEAKTGDIVKIIVTDI
ncbi:MAG: class I SAM-dependent methyltransferase, partial [Proteobacteria bacterium]|nr:class I SAM-dependent methyltransferase [Pseudomonadota bacterium]